MAEGLNRISFEEFSENLAGIIDRVLREGEAVVIEKEEGELVALTPVSAPVAKTKTAADWEAFRAAAGSWADMDTDTFLNAIYESRQSSRPPVDL